MMNNRCFISVVVLLLLGASGCSDNSHVKQQSRAIAVILDTDLGNDIDDVMAMQMLFSYQRRGVVELLGIALSKCSPRVVEYADAFCRFNDIEQMPLGYAYGGVNQQPGLYVHATLDTLVDNKRVLQTNLKLDSSIPEGYKLFRKLLAMQQDSSVVVIAIGPATNLARLLDSSHDEYSELNGVDLVAKKVKFLSIMSGTYNDDVFNNPEWNVCQDLESSKTIYARWPTEIIASGSEVGVRILYPHQSILTDFKNGESNPMCISYKLCAQMPYDNPTWDLTSVLYAIEPKSSCLDISPKGTINIAADGLSSFTLSPEGRHRFLLVKPENIEKVVAKLVQVTTGK